MVNFIFRLFLLCSGIFHLTAAVAQPLAKVINPAINAESIAKVYVDVNTGINTEANATFLSSNIAIFAVSNSAQANKIAIKNSINSEFENADNTYKSSLIFCSFDNKAIRNVERKTLANIYNHLYVIRYLISADIAMSFSLRFLSTVQTSIEHLLFK